MKKDIENLEDVKLLVNEFYGKVRQNELLQPIFDGVIQDRWPEHLEKMYCFWQTILLDEHTYNGAPFPPHALLPVNIQHFNTWLSLFYETVDEFFEGRNADKAKGQGQRMAQIFHHKIDYLRNNPDSLFHENYR